MVFNAEFCRKAETSPYWQPAVKVDKTEFHKAFRARMKSLHGQESPPFTKVFTLDEDVFTVSSSDPSILSLADTDTGSRNIALVDLEDEEVSLPEKARGTPAKPEAVEIMDDTDNESDEKMEVVVPQIRATGTGAVCDMTGPSFLLVKNGSPCQADESPCKKPAGIEYTSFQFSFGRVFLDALSAPAETDVFLSWLALEHGGATVSLDDVAGTRSNVVLGRIITSPECPDDSATCVCRWEPFPFIVESPPFPLKLQHVTSFENPRVINSPVKSLPPAVNEKALAVIGFDTSSTSSSTRTSEWVRALVCGSVKKTLLSTVQERKLVQVNKPGNKRSRSSDHFEGNATPLMEPDKVAVRALVSVDVKMFQKKEEGAVKN